MPGLHVVIGTGPVGRFTALHLLHMGKKVRLLNRSGLMEECPEGAELFRADIRDEKSLAPALQNAEVVYQCAQPQYADWGRDFPPMQRCILAAAAQAGAGLVLAENLYMYGDTQGQPMHESLPYAAQDLKGLTRAAMSQEAFSAHREGRLRVTAARASDFFGPWALEQSALGARSLLPLLAGKPARMLGNPDVPHTYTYVSDFGRALAILGNSDLSWGRVWHVPSAEPEATPRETLQKAAWLCGKNLQIRAMSRRTAGFLSLFIPVLRELLPLYYQMERPYIMDSSRMQTELALQPTPREQALEETLDWIRNHTSTGQ